MKKIVLDAGHYYNTAGKRTPNGVNGVVREWTLNNFVCNYIKEYLKDYDVQIFRVDDTTGLKAITLADRVKSINSINPDVMVSIHHNALNGKFGNHTGVEIYTHTYGSAQDKKLAETIIPKLAKETGLRNRGVKKMALAILTCKTTIPAVLCEGGFMDSSIDYSLITSEKGQRAYAKAVADGLIEYLGLKKVVVDVKPIAPSKPVAPGYTKGVYQTLYVMKVRSGPGTKYKVKSKKELTSDGKANSNIWGHYKKGTKFTALEIIEGNGEVWARGYSGYVCIKDKTRIYCKKV